MMKLLSLLCGCGCGFFLFWTLFVLKKRSFTQVGNLLLQKAQNEADELKIALYKKQKEHEQEHLCKTLLLQKKEHELETRVEFLTKKEHDLLKKEGHLQKRDEDLFLKEHKQTEILQKISQCSKEEAKEYLLAKVENDMRLELFHKRKELEESHEEVAKKILVTTMQRLSVPTVSELAPVTFPLPCEEMKRRIIGKEGRNIRLLEELLHVNILIDDTPNTLLISGFDPIRKSLAKETLTELLKDGRIHPSRIEEAFRKAEKELEKTIKNKGEEAALKGGVFKLHPELITLLGKLHFQSTMGQNLLEHSLEVCYLAGLMAEELALNVPLAKRIALLHDIGKAACQKEEESHAIVGQRLAIKYGENDDVANGIGCHHDEMPPHTLEASLCVTANLLSSSRPGARSEPLEHYIKRVKKMEQLAAQCEGVEQAFALQAGKELRVIVSPEKMDECGMHDLARKLAKKIENELTYPGKIKVTVIYEKKAIEYAR